ncbi:MAG: YgaP family membrane protein [Betaproteobacteria bacterium]
MKVNVGNTDRLIRIIAGVVILSGLFWLEGNARWFGLIGVVTLATGFIRWCPAYSLLGMNTCGNGSKTA